MKKIRLEKGITLIALIITIIILLILAAVTIGTMKDSGIIGHAQDAASSYTIAQEKERIALAYSEYQIQKTFNADIEPNALSVNEATIEPIGNFGWKVSYSNTGNVYGINSKGEYDEAITRIIEVSEATGVGVENFIVYEDKGAINKNAENANTDGYTKIPEKYIFYNWSTVTLEEIDILEERTITSQPENTLICDMSSRALAYDLNGDGILNKKDQALESELWSCSSDVDLGMSEIIKLIPAYTNEKNIKYSSLLGYGGATFWGINYRPILFCADANSAYDSGYEGQILDYMIAGTSSFNENFDILKYYTYERQF